MTKEFNAKRDILRHKITENDINLVTTKYPALTGLKMAKFSILNRTYVVTENGDVVGVYKKACRLHKKTYQARPKYKYQTFNNCIYSTTIHRIIAFAFGKLKYINDKLDVDHIDGDGLNNKLSNLQVITHKENTMKRDFDGRKYYVYKNNKLMGVYLHQAEIVKKYRISQSAISNIINGTYGFKTALGYKIERK